MRRSIAALSAVAVSAGGLWYASLGVDWDEVTAVLRGANYFYLVPMVVFGVGSFYIRALRWRVLLRPLGEFRVGPLFSSTAIGIGFCNMVLPGRAGEVVKPYLLGRWLGVPVAGLLGSSLLERLFDMLSVLFMLGMVLLSLPDAGQLRAWASVPFGLALGLLLVTVLLQRRSRIALGLVEAVAARMPGAVRERTLRLVEGFVAGLQALGSGAALLQAAGWSALLWGIIAASFGMGFLALELQVPLLWGSVVVVVGVAVAVAAPSAPGFIGTFQAGCQVALGIYGISPGQALGYSVFAHAVQFVTQVGLGAACLIYQGVGLEEIRRAERPS